MRTRRMLAVAVAAVLGILMYFNNSGSCAPAESQGQGLALFGAPRMQRDLPSLADDFFTSS